MAALGSAIVANAGKVAQVTGAVAALDAQGWTWFGLASEGGGRRNDMSICNGTNHAIELKKLYIYRGKVKIPPEPLIKSMEEDECLFHNAGSWAATGSCGIVTYQLQHETTLHILWDCPFNFDYHDNFIGLMLTSKSDRLIPNYDLFNNMEQYENYTSLGIKPEAGSDYDLVCCGPSSGHSKEAGGDKPWGHYRPCKVRDEHYEVLAAMGDRHATSSKITIVNVSPTPMFLKRNVSQTNISQTNASQTTNVSQTNVSQTNVSQMNVSQTNVSQTDSAFLCTNSTCCTVN